MNTYGLARYVEELDTNEPKCILSSMKNMIIVMLFDMGVTELYRKSQFNRTLDMEFGEGLEELRASLYSLCHQFAVEFEPSLQKTLQICPLSFGVLDQTVFPSTLFKSSWGPKQPTNAGVPAANENDNNSTTTTATSTVTTTTTTSTTSTTTQLTNDVAFKPAKGRKRNAEEERQPKQKRTKWTHEDHAKFTASMAKRGARDVQGIANDTNKTRAEVKAHINALRLEERRSATPFPSIR